MITLEVSKRDTKTSPDGIRSQGLIPAVFYGRKEKSTSISVKMADFKRAWKEAGESSVLILKGDGVDLQALIHEVVLDPVKDIPRHIDFYAVEKGKKLRVDVPVEFVGTSPAVKDLGGTLVKVIHELEIEAMPANLPHKLEADISALVDLESVIHIKDIVLPEGVTIFAKPDDVVASVSEVVKEEEKPVEATDLSQIEVEKKGKEAKEGEGDETEADSSKA